MDLYLPSTITTPILFYIGWNELRRYPNLQDDVWRRLRDDMFQDIHFRIAYKRYTDAYQIKSSIKDRLLYFINFLLNQCEDAVPIIMRMNKDFMRRYTAYNESKVVAPHFRSDINIMGNAMWKKEHWNWVPDGLRENEEFLLQCVYQHPSFFQYLDAKWKSNEDFLLKAIEHNDNVFEYFDDNRKSDKSFILKALVKNPDVWFDVPESLKLDPTFVVEAIKVNYKIGANEELWNEHPELLGRVIENNNAIIKYIFKRCDLNKWCRDKCIKICIINPKILLKAIRIRGVVALRFLNSSFGSDEEWVLELLEITGYYADEWKKFIVANIDPKMKKNPKFLMKALRINSHHWKDFLAPENSDVKKFSDIYGRVEWRLGMC